MKKPTLAYAIVSLVVVAVVAYALKPERGETPVVAEPTGPSAPTAAAAPEVRERLIGSWRSSEDEQYTVTFQEDGSVAEHYAAQGEIPLADSTGRWLVLVEGDSVALVTTFGEDKTFVYSIVTFDSNSMKLRERDTIRDASFTRIPQ